MGNTTIKLEGGEKIALTDKKMKGELGIPLSVLQVRNWGSQNIQRSIWKDFSGQLFLDLYNDNFFGANVKGRTGIKDKYRHN